MTRSALRELGDRAAAMIEDRYALSVTLPRLVDLFERAASGAMIDGSVSWMDSPRIG